MPQQTYQPEDTMKQIQLSTPAITVSSNVQVQPPVRPSTLPPINSQIHAKMTQPLPTTPPKYNPFDLYPPSIHENNEPKKSAIDNSFFANSFKQTLTSGIGTTKMFEYKPSGKLTLNL